MASKYTIDVEGRFIDNVSDKAKGAADSVEDIGDAADKASKKVKGLGKQKAKPTFDADNNKFIKKVRDAEAKAKKLGNTKAALILSAIDKASTIIGKATAKARSFGSSVWKGVLTVTDKATSIIKGVASAGKSIAGKTWQAVVKIKDTFTTPLTKLKNMLFSIKSLIAGIAAAWAANKFIVQPIGLADAYSSAKIGFQNLLGESGGQQMMDDLDEFARVTPFNTSNVISNAQKMMAMGWDSENLISDLETLGNAAAATGKLDEGLESIVRAMAQIKTKGRLSTEELNQLAEAGIAAKAMLAEQLGYGTGDKGIAAMTKDLEDGAIGSEKAIEALMAGMKKYDGMMQSMANETAEGLLSQIKDTFEINIFRKWGQGLQDGAKKGFGTVLDLLDSSEDALSDLGDTLHDVGKTASNWLADRLGTAVRRIKSITKDANFKGATLGEKVKMLWNGVIANPFSEWWEKTVVPWWDATVVPWLADKAKGIGKGIGSGLTAGITTLLGLDASRAVEDGATIGSAFMNGFLEGFDTDRIGEALSNWASENKGLATTLGVIFGAKLLGALGGWVGNIKGLFGSGSGGSGGLGSAAVATMNVQAGVVNIGTLGGNGTPALPPATGKGAGTIGKIGIWSKIASGLASFGTALGYSGASTAGATAVGAGSALGIIGGALGVGSAGIDIYKGIKNKDNNKFWSAGTKLGITGGGAAAGAGVGALIGALGGPVGAGAGALIGLGVGGIASLFSGEKLSKPIKEFFTETLPEGWNTMWDGLSEFFGETVPDAIEPIREKTAEFFTETVPEKWNGFWDGVGEFFGETIPSAWDSMTEKVSAFFTETIPEKWNEFWDSVGEFFTDTIPYALGYAIGKAYAFFTETIPEKWNAFWDMVGEFFTETIPEWAENIWSSYVVPFFTESIPQFFGSLWNTIKEFFTETIPEWAEYVWGNYIVPFFTESIPQFFASLWDNVVAFTTETLPEWAESVWSNHIVPFFTESIPQFFSSLWNSVVEFTTETLPTWAENVWSNHIAPFFTESVPAFFGSLWDTVSGFFTETLPSIAETIWGSVKTFFMDTIPGWVSDIWNGVKSWFGSVKDSFLSGFGAGSGEGNARGGIVGGSSSMDAFASGGMVQGGAQLVKVAEEGTPEMIIPLGSHRRDRGLKLWAKAGQMMGVPGFARGGRTNGRDEGLRFRRYGSDESSGGQIVQIEVGGITVEFHVTASEGENIVEVIKSKAKEIAETVAGELADALGCQFENTPVKGGAA